MSGQSFLGTTSVVLEDVTQEETPPSRLLVVFASFVGFVVMAATWAVWTYFTDSHSWRESIVSGIVFAAACSIISVAVKIATRLGWLPQGGSDDVDDALLEQRALNRPQRPQPVGIDISFLPVFVGPALCSILLAQSLQDSNEIMAVVWLVLGAAYVFAYRFVKGMWRGRLRR